jgi:hypothetical protein
MKCETINCKKGVLFYSFLLKILKSWWIQMSLKISIIACEKGGKNKNINYVVIFYSRSSLNHESLELIREIEGRDEKGRIIQGG